LLISIFSSETKLNSVTISMGFLFGFTWHIFFIILTQIEVYPSSKTFTKFRSQFSNKHLTDFLNLKHQYIKVSIHKQVQARLVAVESLKVVPCFSVSRN
jgi:hypothetical protein